MAKIKTTTQTEDIKKVIKSSNYIIGTQKTLKAIRSGKMSKVYVAQNAKPTIKDDLKKYAKISGFEIIDLSINNDELGVICKKPFSISILGQTK